MFAAKLCNYTERRKSNSFALNISHATTTNSLTYRQGWQKQRESISYCSTRVDCDYYRLVQHATQISSYINALNA